MHTYGGGKLKKILVINPIATDVWTSIKSIYQVLRVMTLVDATSLKEEPDSIETHL